MEEKELDAASAKKMQDALEKAKLFNDVPKVIVQKNGDSFISYRRGKFLGKGGFARCYEVTDNHNKVHALKVIPKSILKKTRARQKLVMEIRIHRALDHPRIVKFTTFFEDKNYVYIVLELCSNKSMMRMVNKRKTLTESEAQFYLMQLLDGLIYLRQQRVIHRDLKLGNLFISEEMDLKIGDFGLAAKCEDDNDRKKSICGTPNYLAPEMLNGGDLGHSYEVDVWAFGVIMYIFLVGKPPFQGADLKQTYKKIMEGTFTYPEDVKVSNHAKDLIAQILHQDPESRPTLQQIAAHDFFTTSCIPKFIPLIALENTPIKKMNVPASPYHFWATTPERNMALPTSPSKTLASPLRQQESNLHNGNVNPQVTSPQAGFKSPNRTGWTKGMTTPKKPLNSIVNSESNNGNTAPASPPLIAPSKKGIHDAEIANGGRPSRSARSQTAVEQHNLRSPLTNLPLSAASSSGITGTTVSENENNGGIGPPPKNPPPIPPSGLSSAGLLLQSILNNATASSSSTTVNSNTNNNFTVPREDSPRRAVRRKLDDSFHELDKCSNDNNNTTGANNNNTTTTTAENANALAPNNDNSEVAVIANKFANNKDNILAVGIEESKALRKAAVESLRDHRIKKEKISCRDKENAKNANVQSNPVISTVASLVISVIDKPMIEKKVVAENPQSTRVHRWIHKYVDYSKKYGVGYQFNDNTTGVFFNDESQIIFHSDDYMVYWENTNTKTAIRFKPSCFPSEMIVAEERMQTRSSNRLSKPPIHPHLAALLSDKKKLGDLMKKCNLLLHFKGFFDHTEPTTIQAISLQQDRSKAGKRRAAIECEGTVEMIYTGADANNLADDCLPHIPQYVCIKKWKAYNLAAVFVLSNGNFQGNFVDHSKVIGIRENRIVKFVNPTRQCIDVSLEELKNDPEGERQFSDGSVVKVDRLRKKLAQTKLLIRQISST